MGCASKCRIFAIGTRKWCPFGVRRLKILVTALDVHHGSKYLPVLGWKGEQIPRIFLWGGEGKMEK